MKKLSALFLSVLMLFSMYACGNKSTGYAKATGDFSTSNAAPTVKPESEKKREKREPTPEEKAKNALKTLKVWSGTTAESFDGGDGSKDNPYQIANGDQLAKLAADTNSGITFKGKYFILTSDILLNDISDWDYDNIINNVYPAIDYMENQWEPIGLNYSFEGYFDGNGHTIFGLFNKGDYYNEYRAVFGSSVGLFGIIREGSVANVSIICSILKPIAHNVGSLVGQCIYDAGISNCHVDQAFVGNSAGILGGGYNYIGGLCGSGGKIENSTSRAYISYDGMNTHLTIGGIAGSSSIKNCYSDCEIDVYAVVEYTPDSHEIYRRFPSVYVGGISGGEGEEGCFNSSRITVSVHSLVDDSYNDPPIVSIGGIGGSGGNIRNCCSIGTISYRGDVEGANLGGITGELVSSRWLGDNRRMPSVSVSCCYSYNKISSEDYDANIGGIAGSACGNITVTNCYYGAEFAEGAIGITPSVLGSSRLEEYAVNQNAQSIVFTDQIKGLSYEEFLDYKNYYNWDFDTIWMIDKKVNHGFPIPLSLLDYF